MTTAPTVKTPEPKVARPRPGKAASPPEIDPALAQPNREGRYTKSWHIYLPEGVETAQQVHDQHKTMWRKVQSGAWPLGKFDEVTLIAWDESFAIRALVVAANLDTIELGDIRVVQLPNRRGTAPGDDHYQCKFEHGGWQLYRRSDNTPVPDGWCATEAAAWRMIDQQYPKRVA